MKVTDRQSGFTLVEIVLYFTIIGMVLFAIMSFSLQILTISAKSDNMHEIQTNSDFLLNKIVTSIQSADSIDDTGSTFDDDNGVLSLNFGISTVAYSLTDGIVYLTEGVNPPVAISSAGMRCTQLRFTKITGTKIPDQVVIDAQFEPRITGLSNTDYTHAIHTTVSLRQ